MSENSPTTPPLLSPPPRTLSWGEGLKLPVQETINLAEVAFRFGDRTVPGERLAELLGLAGMGASSNAKGE